MIISHKFEFIWFQPRKVASTTIFERLGSYNESEYQQQNYYNKYLNKMSSKHISYEDFLELPEAKLNYKKVSFVRNPYDRFYSDFLQCKKDFNKNHGKFDTKPWGRLLSEGFSRFCEFAFMKYLKGEFFISIKSSYENVFSMVNKLSILLVMWKDLKLTFFKFVVILGLFPPLTILQTLKIYKLNVNPHQ